MKDDALNTNGKPVAGASWVCTFLLCLLFGGFGVHRFYTGYTTLGLIQLTCTLSPLLMIFLSVPISALSFGGGGENVFAMGFLGMFMFCVMLAFVINILWVLFDLLWILLGKYKDADGLPLRR